MEYFLYKKNFWMEFQKRLTAKVQPSVIEANGKKKILFTSLNTVRMVSSSKQEKLKTYIPQRSHILIAAMKIK